MSRTVDAFLISIHAPRTGSDCLSTKCSRPDSLFQSTLPARGATATSSPTRPISTHFNPRSPHGERRGLLLCLLQFPLNFNPRSPHGERQNGCENHLRDTTNFNPRSPHGERRGCRRSALRNQSISIHAPRTGSDSITVTIAVEIHISIHAPRTGSDHGAGDGFGVCDGFQSTLPARGATIVNKIIGRGIRDFNPRSPHGERRSEKISLTNISVFQSTLPARGATVLRNFCMSACPFQSTLPARGATFAAKVKQVHAGTFQSTLPARGATRPFSWLRGNGAISIHAPRTGSDSTSLICQIPSHVFQSTLPARGATARRWTTLST